MAKFSKAHRLALSKAAKARHVKKRGVKPGTKRGPYKKGKRGKNKIITGLEQAIAYAKKDKKTLTTWKGMPITLEQMDAAMEVNKYRSASLDEAKSYAEHVSSVAEALPDLTLCQQLEEAVTRLENRVSNSIARINSLMGKI